MITFVQLAGISAIKKWLVDGYIGPAFLIVIAGVALTLMLNRQFRALIGFVGFCVVIALLIFGGDKLFGEDGAFTKSAKEGASKITNTTFF